MRKRVLITLIVAIIGLTAIGATAVSAHGWFASEPTPDELVQQTTDRFQKEADLLGVSVDDVKNAWAKGQTLPELAEEKGISETDLQKRMTDARQEQLAANLKTLVDRGVITQEQANQRLSVMEERLNDVKGFGHGMGRHQGQHVLMGL